MLKVTVLYTAPTDAAAFEEHYGSVHGPLVDAMPGLVRWEAGKVNATPDGSPAPYYRTADLYFSDGTTMAAAFGSEQGRAANTDAADLAERTGSSVTILISTLD